MALTPDELLGQLKTRGFEEGFQRTPLREFKGKLTSITSAERENNGRKWVVALYNFDELDVVNSTEPYTMPVAQIEISVSNRRQSGMGVFGDSVDRVINVGTDGKPLPPDTPVEKLKGQGWLIGHKLHMKMTGGHMQWDRNKGVETPRECWELVAVLDGATSTGTTATTSTGKSALEVALEILNGKTEQEFYQAAFANPVVKGDGTLVTNIIGHKFLTPLEEAGKITKGSDGKYKVN